MKHHRKTISTAAIVLALSAVTPTGALAVPLLSGYGGPGLGSQAILGATLLNGPANGGGGSAPGGSPTLRSSVESSSGGAHEGARPAGGPATQAARSRVGRAQTPGGSRQASGATQGTQIYPASERELAQPSGTLGLSNQDLLLILLTFAVLAATAVITRRLTPRTQRSDPAG